MVLKYGTIGTNWITESWISAASKTKKWQLHAVYSRTAEKAASFASKHNCQTHYTSLDSLTSDPEVQVIYIASPNNLHFSQATAALKAKKHVILEKPATSTPNELAELLHLARSNGVYLIEAYRHIQEANFKLLRRLLQREQKLGQIYGASFTYASYSSRYTDVLAGRKAPNIFSLDFSGGSLVDIGVYPVTMAVALFGAPKSQTYAPFICRTGVDGGGPIILQYEGFGVQINQAKTYTSTAACEIFGEKGSLTINGTTDFRSIEFADARTKEKEELAGEWKTVEKPFVNMEEEAAEFARFIDENDDAAVRELEEISRAVIHITSDLRRQNGIQYPADAE